MEKAQSYTIKKELMMYKLQGLYLITDEKLTPLDSIIRDVEEVLNSGAKIIQLRDKSHKDDELSLYADEIQSLCIQHNALFVLNDRVDLAIKRGYSGLHVGKSDYENLPQIRENFKGILGVSCYGDINKAKELESLGVDYVAFGSFFPSPTKPNSTVVSLDILKEAKERLTIPTCAIGGISLEKLHLIEADMVAVISDVWSATDREKRVKDYLLKKECV